jgi:hypothetical protein
MIHTFQESPMKTLIRLVPLLLAALVLVGCAGGRKLAEGERRQLAGDNRPAWIDNPHKESTKEQKAFAGMSRQFAMEADARTDARMNAYIQAVDAAGLQGKRMFDQVASLIGASSDILTPGVVQDEMTRLKSRGVAMGEVREWHVEQWELLEKGKLRRYFVVHSLFLMPKDAPRQFMENLLQAQAAAEVDAQVRENINRALEKMQELQSEDW